ncbi:MAG: hypothetical protein ACK4P2_03125 [Hyphomonas sp.]
MNTPMSNPLFLRLADILEQERELLQSGAAAEAAALIEEKMLALQAFETFLERDGVPEAALQARRAIEQIIQMAEENAVHLDAIRNGVRMAISRLEGLNTGAHVGSYGRGGAQLTFTNATGTFSRTA